MHVLIAYSLFNVKIMLEITEIKLIVQDDKAGHRAKHEIPALDREPREFSRFNMI